jgi:hypothetical protein
MRPLVLFALLLASSAAAQTDRSPRFTFWGELQPRASVGFSEAREGDDDDARAGWGVRRARARFRLFLASGLGANYDVDVASGSLESVDLYAFYQPPNPYWYFRVGRMASAQPRAHIGTLLPFIDAVSRPAIAERWGAATIGGDGRDFGVEARYLSSDSEALLFLHNGDGSFGPGRGNVRNEIASGATGGVDRTVQAVSVAGRYFPSGENGFEVGGYAGYNASRNPNTAGRTYASYSGHLYWGADPGSRPLRLKADAIGVTYFDSEDGLAVGDPGSGAWVYGLSGFAAVALSPQSEVFARGELVTTDSEGVARPYARDSAEFFVTAGGSYSISAARGLPYHEQRVTLAYANRLPESEGIGSEHLVVLQLQIVF